MSFAATTTQIENQTKTVTRRLGWANLKPGELVQPIVKGTGLKKGEKQTFIGPPIRCVANVPLPLAPLAKADVVREGFPDMTPRQFVEMFCELNNCNPYGIVNRIEFQYTNWAEMAALAGTHWAEKFLTPLGLIAGRYESDCDDSYLIEPWPGREPVANENLNLCRNYTAREFYELAIANGWKPRFEK